MEILGSYRSQIFLESEFKAIIAPVITEQALIDGSGRSIFISYVAHTRLCRIKCYSKTRLK